MQNGKQPGIFSGAPETLSANVEASAGTRELIYQGKIEIAFCFGTITHSLDNGPRSMVFAFGFLCGTASVTVLEVDNLGKHWKSQFLECPDQRKLCLEINQRKADTIVIENMRQVIGKRHREKTILNLRNIQGCPLVTF